MRHQLLPKARHRFVVRACEVCNPVSFPDVDAFLVNRLTLRNQIWVRERHVFIVDEGFQGLLQLLYVRVPFRGERHGEAQAEEQDAELCDSFHSGIFCWLWFVFSLIVRSEWLFCSVGLAVLFGRICNPTVCNIGICNPAITVSSHYKCLYLLPSDCKSAGTDDSLCSREG